MKPRFNGLTIWIFLSCSVLTVLVQMVSWFGSVQLFGFHTLNEPNHCRLFVMDSSQMQWESNVVFIIKAFDIFTLDNGVFELKNNYHIPPNKQIHVPKSKS